MMQLKPLIRENLEGIGKYHQSYIPITLEFWNNVDVAVELYLLQYLVMVTHFSSFHF